MGNNSEDKCLQAVQYKRWFDGGKEALAFKVCHQTAGAEDHRRGATKSFRPADFYQFADRADMPVQDAAAHCRSSITPHHLLGQLQFHFGQLRGSLSQRLSPQRSPRHNRAAQKATVTSQQGERCRSAAVNDHPVFAGVEFLRSKRGRQAIHPQFFRTVVGQHQAVG